MAFFGLMRRNKQERAGFLLYGRAVVAARDPYFYTDLGVADTLDGRFDLVGLHSFLLIRRLRAAPPPGPALAQAIFDAMFSDMDMNLREIGVGDLAVGRRVKTMWEAFHGRAATYEQHMEAGDVAGLAEALGRNVWRGTVIGDSVAVARLMFAQDAHLGQQPLAALAAGEVDFLPAREAAS
jgi:cytochrome b pre-mRNA-processing protein 3